MRLQGKTALVTAAGQGIGRASALALAAEGAAGLGDRHRRGAARALRRRRQRPRRPPRRARPGRDRARCSRRCRALDVLFNCAGIVHNGSVLDASDDDLELAFASTCARSCGRSRRRCRGMLRAPAAAASSTWRASPRASRACRTAASTASRKAAVIGLTKSVAADYVRAGNPLQRALPRTVDTPSLQRAHQRLRRPGRGAPGLRRPPADGPARAGRGDRADGRVPGQRRVEVRHRAGLLRSMAG